MIKQRGGSPAYGYPVGEGLEMKLKLPLPANRNGGCLTKLPIDKSAFLFQNSVISFDMASDLLKLHGHFRLHLF